MPPAIEPHGRSLNLERPLARLAFRPPRLQVPALHVGRRCQALVGRAGFVHWRLWRRFRWHPHPGRRRGFLRRIRRRPTITSATTMIAMMIHRGSIGSGPLVEPLAGAVLNVAVYALAIGVPGLHASFAAVDTVRVYCVFAANAA